MAQAALHSSSAEQGGARVCILRTRSCVLDSWRTGAGGYACCCGRLERRCGCHLALLVLLFATATLGTSPADACQPTLGTCMGGPDVDCRRPLLSSPVHAPHSRPPQPRLSSPACAPHSCPPPTILSAPTCTPHPCPTPQAFLTPTHLGISMEPAFGGSLFDLVSDSIRLHERHARLLFQQLIAALAWCHSQVRVLAAVGCEMYRSCCCCRLVRLCRLCCVCRCTCCPATDASAAAAASATAASPLLLPLLLRLLLCLPSPLLLRPLASLTPALCAVQGIHHRDVKLENVLLSRPAKEQGSLLKLADFGFSRVSAQGALVFRGAFIARVMRRCGAFMCGGL